MADPHIKSHMDVWDYVTVIIYRSGFTLAVPMLLMLPWYPATAQIGLLISVIFFSSPCGWGCYAKFWVFLSLLWARRF